MPSPERPASVSPPRHQALRAMHPFGEDQFPRDVEGVGSQGRLTSADRFWRADSRRRCHHHSMNRVLQRTA